MRILIYKGHIMQTLQGTMEKIEIFREFEMKMSEHEL